MPKLGIFSGDEICRILQARGFEKIRQRGSHIVMQKNSETGATTIPVPNHKVVRTGTLRAIIRQSGLPRELFIK